MLFGPVTTGAAIDAFESRFTSTAVGHFMIAANGRDAYPVSESESIALRERYRRAMQWARWIRRACFLGVIPLMMLLGALSDDIPEWAVPALRSASALILFGLPLLGLVLHPVISDFTKVAIERPLKRRITTRHPPAVTPVATPLGRFAKRLLIAAFAIEVAIQLFHAVRGRDELAQHMRVLTGLESGNEGWTARLTGNLSSVVVLCVLAGVLLLMLDRRDKRSAARAKAAQAAAKG